MYHICPLWKGEDTGSNENHGRDSGLGSGTKWRIPTEITCFGHFKYVPFRVLS